MIREHHKGLNIHSRKTIANKYKSATPNYTSVMIDTKPIMNPVNAKYQSLRIEGDRVSGGGPIDSGIHGRQA